MNSKMDEASTSHFGDPQPTANLQDNTFLVLQSSLSLQVFKINANVQGILKLVDLLGTARDSTSLRENLDNLTETTLAMVIRGSEDLKELTGLQIGQHQLPILRKTSHDLLLSLKGLLLAQQASLEGREIAGVKPAADDNQVSFRHEYDSVTLSQAQASLSRVPPQEFAYTSLTREGQEDEAEIREIAALVHELAVVLNDFWISFGRQGHIIDNIETDITLVLPNAFQKSAQGYENHPGIIRRVGYLIFILAVVAAVVFLAVRNICSGFGICVILT